MNFKIFRSVRGLSPACMYDGHSHQHGRLDPVLFVAPST